VELVTEVGGAIGPATPGVEATYRVDLRVS
jgi:hypothetical protein